MVETYIEELEAQILALQAQITELKNELARRDIEISRAETVCQRYDKLGLQFAAVQADKEALLVDILKAQDTIEALHEHCSRAEQELGTFRVFPLKACIKQCWKNTKKDIARLLR